MKKSICRAVCVCLVVFFYTQRTQAQSLGDAIVHITFGSGVSTYAPALAADSGSTDYVYMGAVSPDDGQYGIYNTTVGLNPGWVITRDHTGDPNGYMMVVNASYDPGIFYTRRIDGLCGSTAYQFGAWIKNIIKPGSDAILPNVSFSIETLNGKVLGAFDTHDIPENDTWIQYTGTFNTDIGDQSVIVKMTNNAPGGGGNDIAIDDITFRPYGTTLAVQLDQQVAKFCTNMPKTVHIQSTTALDHNYAQMPQRSDDGGKTWVDLGPATTQSDFSFTTSTIAGLYLYRLVKGDAANINVSKCVVASNIIHVTVSPPPVVGFGDLGVDCLGGTLSFTDQTQVEDLIITSWHWDFDENGQTSDEQNPTHTFTTPGIHKVKLVITTDAGCGGEYEKDVQIYPAIQADFTNEIANCPTKTILFTDKSTAPGSIVSNYNWDFGDGTTPVNTGPSPYSHTYATAGPYNVVLTITTSTGCTSTSTKTINVYNPPQVDFTLPEICVTDAIAQFNDNTTVDHTTALSYLWTFGDDANATPANPNTSTEKNPKHTYTEAKDYPITLTVTTAEGCSITTSKTFTVNGANPHAIFTVPNTTLLCSNKEVDFVNNSKVDIGNVARIKWDFGDGMPPVVDDAPTPGKVYHHKYPTLGTPQTYTVNMWAYSGATDLSCQDQAQPQQVNVSASPQLIFNAPDSVCLNFGTVQFAARETAGLPGTGIYSGTGVTAAGLFDPQIAGVGTFDITYSYTANTGCPESITHTIKVNPLTQIDAGPDVAIPEDETTTLHAIATPAEGLTYLWTPATGLSDATSANPVVKIKDDVTYTLTVTNKYGCSVTDQVKVIILHAIRPPNAFTPNGDGVNDTWDIKYLSVFSGCTVDVFNRNGQKVYSSIGYTDKGWDGKYRGADLPVGVYYYLINPKHGYKLISGYVTIIR